MADTLQDGTTPWGTADLTIGSGETAVVYVVESYDPSFPANQSVSKDGEGVPYRQVLTRDVGSASMTIQFPTGTVTPPAQFTKFTYDGTDWIVKDVGKTHGNESESKCTLSLVEELN